MTLAGITRGKVKQARRVLFYGPPGAGKSTIGSKAPDPIFLCAESGTSDIDCVRLPEPQTWDEVFGALDLLKDPSLADRKTLVVDTLDWLEPLVWAHICKKGGKDAIEDFGYGKGYIAALDEWRKFLARLEALRRDRGMWIVLLGHSHIKGFQNPEGDPYDRFQLKLNEKAAGLIKEWCDEVLFARFETLTYKETEKSKAKGVSTGARVMHTVRTAAFDAKNRCSLPETMPLSWDEYAKAVEAHRPADPERLLEEISGYVASLAGAPREVFDGDKFSAALTKAGKDAPTLAVILDTLKGKAALYEQSRVTTGAVMPASTGTDSNSNSTVEGV